MAVLDTRRLVFDAEALREAMRADNHVTRALRLSASEADEIFLLPSEQVVELAQAALLHRLGAQQVAALLIAYCIRAGIPVPRNCRKSIRIEDDRIELHFAKRIPALG